MTEYETIRESAERMARATGAMDDAAIKRARQAGVNALHRIGLTPERVWAATRDMRRAGNGGVS